VTRPHQQDLEKADGSGACALARPRLRDHRCRRSLSSGGMAPSEGGSPAFHLGGMSWRGGFPSRLPIIGAIMSMLRIARKPNPPAIASAASGRERTRIGKAESPAVIIRARPPLF